MGWKNPKWRLIPKYFKSGVFLQEDKEVAELENLKELSTPLTNTEDGSHNLPTLVRQLEDLQQRKTVYAPPIFPDVENPVTHEKSTTVVSQVHHPNLGPFGSFVEPAQPEEQPVETTTTKKEEEKVTPKTYTGAARLTGCATCAADHPKSAKEDESQEATEVTHNGQKRISLEAEKWRPEALFNQGGKQYSSVDLAQYIFWTGDETGVARAIEELISQGLLSRQAALNLLKQIRLEIENLQETYAKAGDNVAPSRLMKLNEIEKKQEADFAEYSLEEVIYQLAKVMFAQSLTDQSINGQAALQRLTSFLETEGAHGRISPGLQKKVLDIFLVALSDTLNENPKIMETAKLELGAFLHKLPSK